jgi:hypothetical protein
VLSLDAGPYAWLVYRLPFSPVAVLLELAYIPVFFVALPPVFLLFPDGVLPSPRWRWVLRSYLVNAVTLVGAAYTVVINLMAAYGIQVDASGGLAALDHPPRSMAWVSKIEVSELPLLAFWVVFAGRLVLSWRRAGRDRRQQLKWLMSGSAIAVACAVIGNVVPTLDPAATPVGVGVVLPACLGVAILKYRLYDIGRIISRTLAYAVVTGLLVAMYGA